VITFCAIVSREFFSLGVSPSQLAVSNTRAVIILVLTQFIKQWIILTGNNSRLLWEKIESVCYKKL